jgi:hypothetical protein
MKELNARELEIARATNRVVAAEKELAAKDAVLASAACEREEANVAVAAIAASQSARETAPVYSFFVAAERRLTLANSQANDARREHLLALDDLARANAMPEARGPAAGARDLFQEGALRAALRAGAYVRAGR